jgi:hypothetical protein
MAAGKRCREHIADMPKTIFRRWKKSKHRNRGHDGRFLAFLTRPGNKEEKLKENLKTYSIILTFCFAVICYIFLLFACMNILLCYFYSSSSHTVNGKRY